MSLIGANVVTSWVKGKFKNALSFNGSATNGRAYGYKGITGNERRTISLWFNTNATNKPILQYGSAGTGTLFEISINNSQSIKIDFGGTTTIAGTGLADGNWHHIAVTIPENSTAILNFILTETEPMGMEQLILLLVIQMTLELERMDQLTLTDKLMTSDCTLPN